jgi:uncharacterized membrane protein
MRHDVIRRSAVYAACLGSFLVMDAVWLGLVSPPVYRDTLGGLLLDQFRLVPAILFYLLYVAGIVTFVPPRARSGTVWTAIPSGAFFGLCAYGTYDLTNQAVLKAWTTELTLTDMAWGMVVTAIASLVATAVDRRFRPRLPGP